MEQNQVLADVFELPSGGKLYDIPDFDPVFTMRSMTTNEEMQRLTKSERPYKAMCTIIDNCITDNHFGMSSYDMCIGDYQYLLHKLRIVTYGPEYKITTVCPICGTSNTDTINLTDMSIMTYQEEFDKYQTFDLPKTKKRITLKYQSPRMLDNISVMTKDRRKKSPEMEGDPSILFTLTELIDKVDDEKLNVLQLENFVRKLPMMDTNYILNMSDKMVAKIGIDTMLNCTCELCGYEYQSPFRITSEFFRPRIDE